MDWLASHEAERDQKMRKQQARISYNYCGICGHVPKDESEPNHAPLRWWDPDDGWKIGTLCHYCQDEVEFVQPKKGDFAFETSNGVADDVNTDEDPSLVF